MTDNSEATNIPDYQKIRQTSRSSGNQGTSTGWNDGVETLTPSPVVRQPISSAESSPRLMPQPSQQQPHQSSSYTGYKWEDKQDGKVGSASSSQSPVTTNTSAAMTGTSKASWEAQQQPQQYRPMKYSLSAMGIGGGGSGYNKDSGNNNNIPYLPQGYTRPVTKYIDANGVERRIIRRTVSPASVNRRSYTEGFLLSNSSDFSSSPFGDHHSRLKSAQSHKNLHHADMFGAGGLKQRDSGSSSYLENSGEIRELSNKNYPLMNPHPQEDWKEIVMSKTPQEDLRHWQQQHQEELLHQHLETQALYENPPNQMLQGQVLADPGLSKLSLQDGPPARWEPVRRAADNIIREKNMIIDKLKNRILELEDDFKMSENKLRQALLTNQDDNNIVQQKLKETQHKNATLKERMNEERVKKDSELDDLEVKLGATEHDVHRLKELLRRKDMDTSSIEAQIAEKAQEAASWRQQFEDSRSTHQEMKKKLDSLQRYLNDLPTVEESRVQAQEILSLREDNLALKSKVESSEKKLSQVRKVITARDFRIRELEEKEKELENQISDVNEELDRMRDAEGYELYKSQRDVQNLSADKDKLSDDLVKAKKLLETTHLKLRQMEAKCQAEVTRVQERLTQETEAVDSLRAEVTAKDEQVEKMKKTIKEMGAQSQDLLHQGLMAKEYARNLEAGNTEATVVEHGRFMGQLGLCFSELRALVDICTKHANGEEPDISVLLGFKDPAHGDDNMPGASSSSSQQEQVQTLSHWSRQLEAMRGQVDKLRAHLCNKYAEDMGNNVHCTTQ